MIYDKSHHYADIGRSLHKPARLIFAQNSLLSATSYAVSALSCRLGLASS